LRMYKTRDLSGGQLYLSSAALDLDRFSHLSDLKDGRYYFLLRNVQVDTFMFYCLETLSFDLDLLASNSHHVDLETTVALARSCSLETCVIVGDGHLRANDYCVALINHSSANITRILLGLCG